MTWRARPQSPITTTVINPLEKRLGRVGWHGDPGQWRLEVRFEMLENRRGLDAAKVKSQRSSYDSRIEQRSNSSL